MNESPKITQIAIAVVERDNQFLIGPRPEGAALAGLWEFPGGKLLPGESPEEGAVRECAEETGLMVQPRFRYPEHVQEYSHGVVHLHFVACEPTGGATNPREPFRWVKREELGNYEFPSGNRALLAILCGLLHS
jgi:8-oxo-dGTP diphosphatase